VLPGYCQLPAATPDTQAQVTQANSTTGEARLDIVPFPCQTAGLWQIPGGRHQATLLCRSHSVSTVKGMESDCSDWSLDGRSAGDA
jgi:hypothetical protein